MSTILVVAPHADDETLGCGGTIARHLAAGDRVVWLLCTRLCEKDFPAATIQRRESELLAVQAIYGKLELCRLDHLTTHLDTVADGVLSKDLRTVLEDVRPDTVYLPYGNDAHTDHHKVFQAGAAAAKTFRFPFVRRVRVYETISETNFNFSPGRGVFTPNVYVEVTGHLETKLRAMAAYQGETQPHPFPRSMEAIRALALLRGSECGKEYAEAFMALKEIE